MNSILKRKGFTLIELLVVIAIIGILASVVLASLNTARRKSRDARRIADVRQLQLALELFFDARQTYVVGTVLEGITGVGNDLEDGCSGDSPCIAEVPEGPTGDVYRYQSSTIVGATISNCTVTPCNYYQLGANLEEDGTGGAGTGGNPALAADRDLNITGSNVQGLGTDCAAVGTNDGCYDLTP